MKTTREHTEIAFEFHLAQSCFRGSLHLIVANEARKLALQIPAEVCGCLNLVGFTGCCASELT